MLQALSVLPHIHLYSREIFKKGKIHSKTKQNIFPFHRYFFSDMVLNYIQISRNYYKIKPVPNKVDRAISQFQISYVTRFLTTTKYEKNIH